MGNTLKAIGRIALTVGGYIVAGPLGAAIGTLAGSILLKPKIPRVPLAQLDRLNASLNPTAPRTMDLGETALGTDIRYIYPSGTDQRYVDYIIGCACHKVESIDELWIEDRLAWSSASGYAAWTIIGGTNRLTVTTRTEGTSANAINIGGAWTGSARLTGCAYIRVRIDRQGTKKTDSPFASGLPSRITIRGKGMPLYDPRLDSTRGGSGTHRADDQATWGTTTGRNNPALQILAYLIGWRIGGKLSVGRGVPLDDIDFDSFITAANACDEDVSLLAGGTQNRYETAGMCSEDDEADTVLGALTASCNAELRDYNGRISLYVKVNDLAVPVASFSDQNILSGFRSSTGNVTAIPNLVRGRFTDPSNNALYNLTDFPEISLTSVDGIERVLPLDLPYVQEGRRAQRIAKQVLQRAQYPDTYEAEFDITALKCRAGDVVEISFESLGWVDKLFRVARQTLTQTGSISMQLRVENADIYAWDTDETAVVEAADPTTFDPLNAGDILAAAAAAETANWSGIVDDGGKPEDGATVGVPGNLLKDKTFTLWTKQTGVTYGAGPAGSGWGEPPSNPLLLIDLAAIAAAGSNYQTERWEVKAGERIYGTILAAASNAANQPIKHYIAWYKADNTLISTSAETTLDIATWVPAGVGGAYLASTVTALAPANTAFGRHVIATTAVGTGSWRVGFPLVSRHQPGADVTATSTVGLNFNARNDRLSAAVTAPTIVTDGSAVDHAIATDGSANISFEWAWGGTEADIDGFEVYVYQSTASSAYTFGTTPAAEQAFTVPADRRAFVLYGVPANQYYTFFVRAFRIVDPDVNAAGLIRSSIVKPSLTAENPYRPASAVAFAGDVSGTIDGVAAATVKNYTRNVDRGAWSSASVAYVIGDEVQDQDSTWGALTNHTSSALNGPPTLPTTENATWRLRARVGDAGPEGPIVSPPSQAFSIACNSTGTPKAGEFNKVVTFTVMQGATNLSDDAGTDYVLTTPSGYSGSMGGTNGKVLTITAMSADTATATVTVQRSGVTIAVVAVTLTKVKDGAASNQAADTTITSPASGTLTVVSSTLEIPVGPSGTIYAAFDATYTVTSNSTAVTGRIEYREKGDATWLLFDSQTTGSIAGVGEPGDISMNKSIAAPAGLSVYEFQLLLSRSGSPGGFSFSPGNFSVRYEP